MAAAPASSIKTLSFSKITEMTRKFAALFGRKKVSAYPDPKTLVIVGVKDMQSCASQHTQDWRTDSRPN